MKEERLLILKLFKEGKITEEEADKLLDGLQEKKEPKTFDSAKKRIGESLGTAEESFQEKRKTFKKDFEENFEDLEDKFEDFSEDFSKKMNRLGGLIAHTSTAVADKILHSVEEALESQEFQQYDVFTKKETFHETLEIPLTDLTNYRVQISSLSGKVKVESWEKDYLKLKAKIQMNAEDYKEQRLIYEAHLDEELLEFSPRIEKGFYSFLTLYLPKALYDSLTIHNRNGSVFIEDYEGKHLEVVTQNGSIQLYRSSIKELGKLKTKNSKILLHRVHGGELVAQTKNGKILGEVIDTKILDCKTTLGSIGLDELSYDRLERIHLQTTNGHLKIFDPLPEDCGIRLLAQTKNGEIEVGTDLDLIENQQDRNHIRINGRSKNLEELERTIDIQAYTTNGDIVLF